MKLHVLLLLPSWWAFYSLAKAEFYPQLELGGVNFGSCVHTTGKDVRLNVIKVLAHASGIQRAPGCFARVWKHPGSRTIWAWSLSLNESNRDYAKMKLERVCVRIRLLCVYSPSCCFLDSWPVLDLFIWNHLIWWATFCQNTVSLTVVRALCFLFDLLYCQGAPE